MRCPPAKRARWRPSLLSLDELKTWLHRDLSQKDKLLLILAALNKPSQIADMKRLGTEAGFRIPSSWNPSASLANSKGLAIRAPSGWEITDAGKQHLRNLGVTKLSEPRRVCRRLIWFSYAAMASVSRAA